MKSIHVHRIAAVFFATWLSVTAGVAHAQPHHADAGPQPGMMMHRMLKGLDLTESQQKQIKALTDTFRANQPERADMQAQREKLQAFVKADHFDSNAVRALLEQQQTIRLDREVAVLQYMHDVRAVLTAEQKAKLDAKVDAMKQRAKERMAERAER